MEQIIALGGGGFSMEPNNLALDRYILNQIRVPAPKVCFLPQAGGENDDYIIRFYRAFTELSAHPNHLSLFQPHTSDIEDFIMSQDIIYVGGGNTKSLLALWYAWGLDQILREALKNGIVLAGISAGAICWFDQGTTDSIPSGLTVISCLGFLQGSCSPHYDGEVQRRPTLHHLIENETIQPGYAFDDGASGHFIDGKLHKVVSSRPQAKGYYVEMVDGRVEETMLDTNYLLG